MLIGAFALGQAGPNVESLFTAAGAAGSIFDTIDRVSSNGFLLILTANIPYIAGNFDGELNLGVWLFGPTTAQLNSVNISYTQIYVWRYCTKPPNLNSPIILLCELMHQQWCSPKCLAYVMCAYMFVVRT